MNEENKTTEPIPVQKVKKVTLTFYEPMHGILANQAKKRSMPLATYLKVLILNGIELNLEKESDNEKS